MSQRMPVYVQALDPLTQAGITGALRGRPELQLVDEVDLPDAAVAVVAMDDVGDEGLQAVRALKRSGCARIVLVVAQPEETGMLAAIEAGVCGLVRRAEATPEALTAAILAAAAGNGTLPPDLLGRLLSAVGRLQQQVLNPRGLTFTSLTEREIDVLALVAEGFDTCEISAKLAYSERTIKNVIHDVTLRLNLRNRTHAVAYALRKGLI